MLAFLQIATAGPLGVLLTRAYAAEPKVAVFDKLVDTSLEGATFGPRADQQASLAQIADQPRDQLAKSGLLTAVKFLGLSPREPVLPIHEVAAAAMRNLQGQWSPISRGWELILNMNIVVGNAKTDCLLSFRSVDMCGRTDERWSRAIDWLIRYDLLAPPSQGVFQ